MSKKQRIAELERRVAELEARPAAITPDIWTNIGPQKCPSCGMVGYGGHYCAVAASHSGVN